MDSSFWFDTINLEWPTVWIEGITCYNSQIQLYIFLKSVDVLASSVDPDEMPHYAAFHLDLHSLPKYTFRKKGDKDQESIQSSTTPDPGYHMGK